jgi:hypothetical protein
VIVSTTHSASNGGQIGDALEAAKRAREAAARPPTRG